MFNPEEKVKKKTHKRESHAGVLGDRKHNKTTRKINKFFLRSLHDLRDLICYTKLQKERKKIAGGVMPAKWPNIFSWARICSDKGASLGSGRQLGDLETLVQSKTKEGHFEKAGSQPYRWLTECMQSGYRKGNSTPLGTLPQPSLVVGL